MFSTCTSTPAVPSPTPAVAAVTPSLSPEPTAKPTATSQTAYKPTQQVFDETFMAIRKLIEQLNELIQHRDYQAWLNMLSPDYRVHFSRPETLSAQNDSKFLQSKGVTIKTLEDYFLNVVVPSRASARLDDLFFLNEHEVEAIMQVGNRRVTVYSLINIEGKWKIGLSNNGQ